MEIAMIVGWVIYITSWIIPPFIKDVSSRRFVGLVLKTFALGIFLGHGLS